MEFNESGQSQGKPNVKRLITLLTTVGNVKIHKVKKLYIRLRHVESDNSLYFVFKMRI